MSTLNILLVLGNPAFAEELQHHLRQQGSQAEWVPNDEQGVNGLIANRFDVLIADLDSSRVDGMRLLSVAHGRDTTIPVILLTSSLQTDRAMQALESGATAVLAEPHPVELVDRAVVQGQKTRELHHQVAQLKRQLDTRHALTNLIGPSRQMATIHEQVREASPGIAPIILLGETGTGRDHLARIIHTQSPRSHRSFVKVTFGANAAPTIQRELFGCGAGVYPDAPQGESGRIEYADKGTLYLDNLSSLTPIHAEQLMSCLETRRVQRLGDTREIPVDLRLIVSVTPPLETNDPTQNFLDQLRQRFGALTLELAPLRDRPDDIVPLTEHFLEHHASASNKIVSGIETEVLQALTRYPWPENLRQLESVIAQMITATKSGQALNHCAIPQSIRDDAHVLPDSISLAVGTSMHDVERAMIEVTMLACNYDKDQCAAQLGIGLRTLYRKLKEYKSA